MSSAGWRAACCGPSADGEAWSFEPVDVARARLLAELTDEMGFDDEAVETVVDLLDQVHTLRRQLHQLGQAIGRAAGRDPRGDRGGAEAMASARR